MKISCAIHLCFLIGLGAACSSPPLEGLPTNNGPSIAAPDPTNTMKTNPAPVETAVTESFVSEFVRINLLPPGRYLAFYGIELDSPEGKYSPALFLASEQGDVQGKLLEGDFGRPTLSPDRSTIAAEMFLDGYNNPASIVLIDTEDRQVQALEAGKGCSFPAWAPDSLSIAVSCDLDIYIIDLTTLQKSLAVDCTSDDNACTDPQWSPDGSFLYIYRAMEFRPNPGIYRIESACSEAKPGCDLDPQFFLAGTAPLGWSPTGERLAFNTFEGDLGIANAQGEILEKIQIPGSGQILSMAWSQEGDTIALSLDTYSNGQDTYLLSFETMEWKGLQLAEGDSIVHFWITIPD